MLVLSCTDSEVGLLKGQKSPNFPVEFLDELYEAKTLVMHGAIRRRRFRDPSLRRFDTIPAYDRQTDRQTDTPTV